MSPFRDRSVYTHCRNCGATKKSAEPCVSCYGSQAPGKQPCATCVSYQRNQWAPEKGYCTRIEDFVRNYWTGCQLHVKEAPPNHSRG